jgi:uroporphyrinogen-III decarboxylase
LDGICDGHPLASWSALDTWHAPDPAAHVDWQQARHAVEQAHSRGGTYGGGTDHGFIFLRLTYLRGFDNFMMDVADQPAALDRLVGLVEGYWRGVVERWVELGVDEVSFGDDLGLQHALPLSPEAWRRVIKPVYRRLFSYCRARGVHVALHTDGYIVDIIPDLIECGLSALNPQDLVNGLGALARLAKGRVYLRLDIDRQSITVFGRPEAADAHVLDCIRTLGSPTGGLSLIWGVYPGTPLANIEAVARAMDKYATYWGRGSAGA